MSFLVRRRLPATDLQTVAERLHDHLVAAVRQPVFYMNGGVPDTFEGRFDLLILHVALALRRLRLEGEGGEAVAQLLVDTMFARFDVALRELGVSDLGVPKRMKRLARAFNGRVTVYLNALEAEDHETLAEAIARNVLGGAGDGAGLAAYAFRVDAVFASADLSTASEGPVLPDPLGPV